MSTSITPPVLPIFGKLSLSKRRIYEKCGLDPALVTSQPAITPQLRKLARETSKILPLGPEENPTIGIPILDAAKKDFSPEDPLFYLHVSSDPAAQEILAKYYAIEPRYRRFLPLEAYCLLASVPTTRCFEIIVATCVRIGAQASLLLAAVAQPSVVKKTIDMALTDEGSRDRETLHKHAGFLPTPRGPSISVPVTVNASANAASVAAPPPERTISRMADRFNDARLPGGDSPSPPIADVVEVEVEPDDVDEDSGE